MGAKNNDSTSEKQAIVKFYTMEYRKCGNSNSKNDSRLWVGASTFLKSVYFRAFAVNVKTIAPKKYLYQFGHAIWWGEAPRIMSTFVESYDFSGKTLAAFCTSASSGFGSSDSALRDAADSAIWLDGCRFSSGASAEDVMEWADGLGINGTENGVK